MISLATRPTATLSADGRTWHPAITTDGKTWHWSQRLPTEETARTIAEQHLTLLTGTLNRAAAEWKLERAMEHGPEFFLSLFVQARGQAFRGTPAQIAEAIAQAREAKPQTESWFRQLVLHHMTDQHRALGAHAREPKGQAAEAPVQAPAKRTSAPRTRRPKFNPADFLADLGL